LLLGVYLLQLLLKHPLYGLLEFLLQLILFLYCLGPQNLWADTLACVSAFHHDEVPVVSERFQASFGVTAIVSKESLLSPIFVAAHKRIFACVFWFVIAGPVGVILYRATTTAVASLTPNELQTLSAATTLEALLDFIPARILACLFALAGHFANVLTCWKSLAIFKLNMNERLLAQTGNAALGADEMNQLSDEVVVKNALALLDRVFIISIVILALAVLMS
jgi:AmpE protein